MPTQLQIARDWVLSRLAARLAEVFEGMTGVKPQVQSGAPQDTAPASSPDAARWQQTFNGVPGSLWIYASAGAWGELAHHILHAAGIENPDAPLTRSSWNEALGQTLAGLAVDFSARLSREVACTTGAESPDAGPLSWSNLTIQFPGNPPTTVEIACAIDDTLAQALPPAAALVAAAEPPASKTFDLLLDVELPVSVSFGRAQVLLKDVIKLTTGAIVELNRSIAEPVEVIVNNCVIARGEVVVVEGNFGVRIREVISRQDRLRTLN